MALCTAVKVIDAVALIVPFKEAGFDKLGNGTTEIEKQIEANGHNRSQMLWAYAQLYGELWCDPRISARTPTRRIMLAMSTVLRGRSAHLAAALSRVDATMAK